MTDADLDAFRDAWVTVPSGQTGLRYIEALEAEELLVAVGEEASEWRWKAAAGGDEVAIASLADIDSVPPTDE